MTIEFQDTHEEEVALHQLLEEKGDMLGEAACTILDQALSSAYIDCILDNPYYYYSEDYDKDLREMHLAAASLTDQDREFLAEISCAHRLAAYSIEPDDETFVYRRIINVVRRRHYHRYYKMVSDILDKVLQV